MSSSKKDLMVNRSSPSMSWRNTRYKRFYEIVDQLVSEVQQLVWKETNTVKRRLGGNELAKLHYSIECLVRDCMAVVLQRKRKGEATIKLGQYNYGSTRSDLMLTYKVHVQRAFKALIEMEYLQVSQSGFYDRKGRKDGTATSRLTRYVATDKLLKLFTSEELKSLPALVPVYADPELIKVRLKEKDQHGVFGNVSVPFTKSQETDRIYTNLEIINKALSKHWYDLEISDNSLVQLQERLANDQTNPRQLRFDQRSLYRVFNDPELTTGGRFYGGWWQNIPKEYRSHLTINGKSTVELDYSNQHPSILYAQEGLVRPADCYSGVIPPELTPQTASLSDLRGMIKAAFNAMLNSPKPLSQPPNGVYPKAFGLTWRQVSESILKFHEPIAHHFYTGIGLKLQRLDSDIAEKVLLYFSQKYIPVLPLHDSFLMHHGYESTLKPVMEAAFKEIVGVTPLVDQKKTSRLEDSSNTIQDDFFGPNLSDELSEILTELDVGYENRLAAFRTLIQTN